MRVGISESLASAAVAGRWTSRLPPRPSLTRRERRGGVALEVFPWRPLPAQARRSTLVTLARLQSARDPVGTARPTPEGVGPTRHRVRTPGTNPACSFLSWPRPLLASPPVSGRPKAASLARPLPASANAGLRVGIPPRHPVPPAWFLTTSAACSAPGLRVCCAPLPVLRFIAFPAVAPAHSRKRRQLEPAFPATRSIPFEGFPSSAAAPRHRGRCLPAVTAAAQRPTRPKPSGSPTPVTRGRRADACATSKLWYTRR